MVSAADAKTWLVAYDIRELRRLLRLHRMLRREGTHVQYSAFCVEADDERIDALMSRIEARIDTSVDDVRAYHVPAHCRVWQLGRQQFPEGIVIAGSEAVRQLLQSATAQPDDPAPEEDEEVARS